MKLSIVTDVFNRTGTITDALSSVQDQSHALLEHVIQDGGSSDGTPRKLMDVSRLAEMGWSARIPLEEGVRETYQWFLQNIDTYRH